MSSTLPTVLTSHIEGALARLELELPADLDYFRGHFPGFPVLPGVVQMHWAMHYARELLDMPDSFRGVEVLKFQKTLHPHDVVVLALRLDADAGRLHFSFERDGERTSSGRVLLD